MQTVVCLLVCCGGLSVQVVHVLDVSASSSSFAESPCGTTEPSSHPLHSLAHPTDELQASATRLQACKVLARSTFISMMKQQVGLAWLHGLD